MKYDCTGMAARHECSRVSGKIVGRWSVLMNHFSENYNLIVGLLAGALLYPLAKMLAAGGLAGSNSSGRLGSSSDLGDACVRFLSASFVLTRRWFHRSGDLLQAGEDIKASTLHQDNPREEQIKAVSQVLRNVLQSLSVVIQRTDQAASTSNQTLGDVRNSIGQMDIPNDLAEDHKQLMREIDRIISGNMLLKQELSHSQDILASQRRQIEKLRSAVRLDGLTQLANRAYFDEKLAAVMKLQSGTRIIFHS
jgi:diguanylate cyclase